MVRNYSCFNVIPQNFHIIRLNESTEYTFSVITIFAYLWTETVSFQKNSYKDITNSHTRLLHAIV